jgi:hypothetical protein
MIEGARCQSALETTVDRGARKMKQLGMIFVEPLTMSM